MKAVAYLWQQMVRRVSQALLCRKNLPPAALLGRQAEEAAYWHLRQQGFIMVERNYHPAGLRSEIDLIGWEGNTLVFVEVKARRDAAIRLPEAAVDRGKRHNLVTAARYYRKRTNHFSTPFRFDIISVVPSSAGMEIQHFRDAFQEGTYPSGSGSTQR